MGTPIIREAIDNGTTAQNIYDDYIRNDLKNFIVTREEFLIDEYAWIHNGWNIWSNIVI